MPLFFLPLRDGMDELIDPEGIRLPNLTGPKSLRHEERVQHHGRRHRERKARPEPSD